MHADPHSLPLPHLLLPSAMGLNPEAAEFFPAYYHHSQQITPAGSPAYHHPFLPTTSFLSPSLHADLPYCYYATNTTIRYTASPDEHNLVVEQNHGTFLQPEAGCCFLAAPPSQQGNVKLGPRLGLKEVVVSQPFNIPGSAKKGRKGKCFRGKYSSGGGSNTRGKQVSKKESRREKPVSCDQRLQCSIKWGVSSYERIKPKEHQPVVSLEPNGQVTSVMIKNIPNRYTRQMVIEFLDNYCMEENQKAKLQQEPTVSAFDFLYLPVDFENGVNKGYAFVNFTNATAAWKFKSATSNQPWVGTKSNKIRQVTSAKFQGKEALVMHLRSSLFDCESDEFLPVCFSPARDGSGAMVEQKIVGRRTDNYQI
ncbi:hypothetical protein Tsubulata_035903 [Turnera subulata]|uniref:Mei2-like C-terminal RNA recognition motif domain-containing protein n=1 Tax=Turnera subulata TaxID=218843 RepID=A0A9Q0JFP5_9ROSI|nr:hypothetical protein Tsubulata_035903 [Turnera subulata]